jgi:hypothetical protein
LKFNFGVELAETQNGSRKDFRYRSSQEADPQGACSTVAAAFKVPPLSMKSVLASYTLSLAVFIPISGSMADRFGTRRVFASAIAFFYDGVIPVRLD